MTVADLIERAWAFAFLLDNIIRSAVRLCGALALMAGGAFMTFAAIVVLQLPDAALRQLDGGSPSPDELAGDRVILAFVMAMFVVMAMRGWDRFKRWCQPRDENARRVAELERQLSEVGQFADEAAQFAAEAEGAREALAEVAVVFGIPGVLEAARRAARKALHPDSFPGASADEVRDLTERFQFAESVFDHFSNA
jgi:hypothetical protein